MNAFVCRSVSARNPIRPQTTQKILLQNSTTCSVVFLLRTAVGGTETLSFCRARKRLTKFYLLSRSYLRSVFPLFKTNFVSCAQSGAHTGACESARQGAVTLICHQRKHGADRRHIVSVCHAATGKTKDSKVIFEMCKSVKATFMFAKVFWCPTVKQTMSQPGRGLLITERPAG